jgi:hypothetical protein
MSHEGAASSYNRAVSAPTEHHWAGFASLRLDAGVTHPGFTQLKFAARGGAIEAWSGLFFPGMPIATIPSAGAESELVLPNELVARAFVGEEENGALELAGRTPWAEWSDLFRAESEPEAPILFSHDRYLEARGPSTISIENWVTVDQLPLRRGERLLLDYRPVKAVTVPFEWFLSAAEGLERMGVKVAVVAASPLAFGISRQAILTAALDEERAFRVFRDYDDGRDWLLA